MKRKIVPEQRLKLYITYIYIYILYIILFIFIYIVYYIIYIYILYIILYIYIYHLIDKRPQLIPLTSFTHLNINSKTSAIPIISGILLGLIRNITILHW